LAHIYKETKPKHHTQLYKAINRKHAVKQGIREAAVDLWLYLKEQTVQKFTVSPK